MIAYLKYIIYGKELFTLLDLYKHQKYVLDVYSTHVFTSIENYNT